MGNILPKENVSHHPILLPRTKANALSIIKIAHYRYLITRRILPYSVGYVYLSTVARTLKQYILMRDPMIFSKVFIMSIRY